MVQTIDHVATVSYPKFLDVTELMDKYFGIFNISDLNKRAVRLGVKFQDAPKLGRLYAHPAIPSATGYFVTPLTGRKPYFEARREEFENWKVHYHMVFPKSPRPYCEASERHSSDQFVVEYYRLVVDEDEPRLEGRVRFFVCHVPATSSMEEIHQSLYTKDVGLQVTPGEAKVFFLEVGSTKPNLTQEWWWTLAPAMSFQLAPGIPQECLSNLYVYGCPDSPEDGPKVENARSMSLYNSISGRLKMCYYSSHVDTIPCRFGFRATVFPVRNIPLSEPLNNGMANVSIVDPIVVPRWRSVAVFAEDQVDIVLHGKYMFDRIHDTPLTFVIDQLPEIGSLVEINTGKLISFAGRLPLGQNMIRFKAAPGFFNTFVDRNCTKIAHKKPLLIKYHAEMGNFSSAISTMNVQVLPARHPSSMFTSKLERNVNIPHRGATSLINPPLEISNGHSGNDLYPIHVTLEGSRNPPILFKINFDPELEKVSFPSYTVAIDPMENVSIGELVTFNYSDPQDRHCILQGCDKPVHLHGPRKVINRVLGGLEVFSPLVLVKRSFDESGFFKVALIDDDGKTVRDTIQVEIQLEPSGWKSSEIDRSFEDFPASAILALITGFSILAIFLARWHHRRRKRNPCLEEEQDGGEKYLGVNIIKV